MKTPQSVFAKDRNATQWVLWAWIMVVFAGYMFQFVPIIEPVLAIYGFR